MGKKHFLSKFTKKNSVGTMEDLNLSKALKEAQEKLDADTVKTMKKYLNEITSSGSPSLDNLTMKKFKQICRKSDDFVKLAFFLVMEQLQKKHSEIRLSAFQVTNELFQRSHAFRELLITHLKEFLTLTTETEAGQLLPPPKPAANKLKTDVFKAMQEWHEKFGKAYRKLAVGYDYLKNCKHIDFDNIQAQNIAEKKRIEEEERRKQKLMADRLEKVLKDIAESRKEIDDCLKEADSCLSLILPDLNDFTLPITPMDSGNNEKIGHETKTVEGDMCTTRNKEDLSDDNHSFNETQSSSEPSKSCVNSYVEDKQPVQENTEADDLNSDSFCDLKCCKSKTCKHRNDKSRDSNESQEAENASIKVATNPTMVKAHDNERKDVNSQDSNSGKDGSDISEEDEEEEEDEDDFNLQVHGLQRPGFSLTIELPSQGLAIEKTEDNEDIMQSLKDISKLISGSYLPRVTKWLENLGKNGGNEQNIKAMIDLKVKLESVITKCMDLKLSGKEEISDNKDSDDDEDMEDVPEKEGYEPEVPKHIMKEWELSVSRMSTGTPAKASVKRKASTDSMSSSGGSKKLSTTLFWNLKEREKFGSIEDPTSRAAALARLGYEDSLRPSTSKDSQDSFASSTSSPSSSQETKSADVPFVQFGKDLVHWENPDEMEAPQIIKYDSLHRFWTPAEKETEKASEHDKAAMQYRVINFTGNFEPVKWKCRAPLPNGKLCERMDRVKCPFHGKIIARDKDGKPNNSNSDEKAASHKNEATDITDGGESNDEEQPKALPPWLDPELQREIEAATGHDLGSARSQKLLDKEASKKRKGKGKGRGKKSTGLTDINTGKNTARTRLEKRVFNKGSMKKVCARLDAADFKRVRDKFGNQFNYSLH